MVLRIVKGFPGQKEVFIPKLARRPISVQHLFRYVYGSGNPVDAGVGAECFKESVESGFDFFGLWLGGWELVRVPGDKLVSFK